MNRWKWVPWLLVAVLAAALLYERFGPRDLPDAMRSGRVQAQVAMVPIAGAEGDDPDGVGGTAGMRVALTLRRAEGHGGRVSVHWPAGSLVRSDTTGEQRLMTARDVAVVLDDASPEARVEVEVYCLDQFAVTPTAASPLSLPDDDGSVTEETEPVRKLAQCLAEGGATASARQYAIWMTANGYLLQDRATVRERLVDAYRMSLRAHAENRLKAVEADLRARMPELAPDRVDAAVERYRRDRLEQDVERTAREQADRDANAFDGEARDALARCRDDLASQPYYASGM